MELKQAEILAVVVVRAEVGFVAAVDRVVAAVGRVVVDSIPVELGTVQTHRETVAVVVAVGMFQVQQEPAGCKVAERVVVAARNLVVVVVGVVVVAVENKEQHHRTGVQPEVLDSIPLQPSDLAYWMSAVVVGQGIGLEV